LVRKRRSMRSIFRLKRVKRSRMGGGSRKIIGGWGSICRGGLGMNETIGTITIRDNYH
jgi:hypothetical protein